MSSYFSRFAQWESELDLTSESDYQRVADAYKKFNHRLNTDAEMTDEVRSDIQVTLKSMVQAMEGFDIEIPEPKYDAHKVAVPEEDLLSLGALGDETDSSIKQLEGESKKNAINDLLSHPSINMGIKR